MSGQPVPVTLDLGVGPLFRSHKPVVNGHGQQIMNDQWIYLTDSNGNNYAINVYRSMYCEKMYLSNVDIQESIGDKKLMDKDLKNFCEQVSDKLVFEKYGRWYRIYLRKISSRTFGISKVVPYISVYNPNARVLGMWAHEMCIDWRKKFHLK